MTNEKRALVLRLARFLYQAEAIEAAHAGGAEMDAGFDGGEWSGPDHVRVMVREQDDLAVRLGFANSDLAFAVAARLGVTGGVR